MDDPPGAHLSRRRASRLSKKRASRTPPFTPSPSCSCATDYTASCMRPRRVPRGALLHRCNALPTRGVSAVRQRGMPGCYHRDRTRAEATGEAQGATSTGARTNVASRTWGCRIARAPTKPGTGSTWCMVQQAGPSGSPATQSIRGDDVASKVTANSSSGRVSPSPSALMKASLRVQQR